jgi:ribonuclease HI
MHEFFIDGSFSKNTLGIGIVYSNDKGFIETYSKSLIKPNGTSVEAEFWAAQIAIEISLEKLIDKAIIFTDCENLLIFQDTILNKDSYKPIQGTEKLEKYVNLFKDGILELKRYDEKSFFHHTFAHNLSRIYMKNYTALISKIMPVKENIEFVSIVDDKPSICQIGDICVTSSKIRSAFYDAVEQHLNQFPDISLALPLHLAEHFFFLEGNRSKINRLREIFSSGIVMIYDHNKEKPA